MYSFPSSVVEGVDLIVRSDGVRASQSNFGNNRNAATLAWFAGHQVQDPGVNEMFSRSTIRPPTTIDLSKRRQQQPS